jgi:UDP-N-acetylglucosamine 1-carboxyvinyltransferase
MALAGVTGGELRVKDVIHDDLRMIRLVFSRIGLHSEVDGADIIVPGGQTLVRLARPRRVQVEDPGRPVARVPGRPDVDRGRDGDTVRRVDPHPRVDVREPPDLHRQARVDGRGHRDVRPAPGDRHRPLAAARDHRRVARHPRRNGDAHRRPLRRGRSEIANIWQIDRGYERIDERLRDLGARIERVSTEPARV